LEVQNIVTEVLDLPFPVDTRSIVYVNMDHRSCRKIRFVGIQKNNRNVTFLKLSEPTIPLERILTINNPQYDFLLHHENEDDLRVEFLHAVLDKKEQAEREEKAQREALEKLEREEEERKAVIHVVSLEVQERAGLGNEIKPMDNEKIEQEMARRAEEAKERPIHMTPEQWEWYKKTGRMYTSGEKDVVLRQVNPSSEDMYAKQQRVKFKQKLLTYPIKGDQFIDGPPSKWRGYILRWINTHQVEESLIVSMKELLNDMKASGITFNQLESHVQHPVREFLLFYQSGLKREMKRKINIIFVE